MAKLDGLDVERDFGGVIHDAYANGVGTAIYSPLAGGFLTNAIIAGGERHPLAGPRDTDAEVYRRDLQRAQALSFLTDQGTDTLTQVAIRFILMHPGVTVVLGGFSEMAHLEEIAPVSGSGPLAPEVMSRLEQVWSANFGNVSRHQPE